jgi:hypothetical protein
MSLVHCHRCDAQYSPGGWSLTWKMPGDNTTGAVGPHIRSIPDEHCPMCLMPPQIEPNPQRPGPM